MTHKLLTAFGVLAALALPAACKFVKTSTPRTTEAVEQSHVAAVLDQTYQSQLLPFIEGNAQPLADLRAAITTDILAAGQAHGNRGAGKGAAWNFAIQGSGKVVTANLKSRARSAELDTDGDGKPDLTLQLGPVIKGTALRDVAPFYDFGDFRDQIEFAELARAINDRVSAGLVLPDGELTGKSVAFTGAVPLKSATDPWLVTAVTVQVQP